MKAQALNGRAGRSFRAKVQGDLSRLGEGLLRVHPQGARWALEDEEGRAASIKAAGQEAQGALRVFADHGADALVWREPQSVALEGLLFPTQRLAEAPRIVVPDEQLEKLPWSARSHLKAWFESEFVLHGGLLVYVGGGHFNPEDGLDLIGQESRWTVGFEEGDWLVKQARRDHRRCKDAIWLRLDAPPTVIEAQARALDDTLRGPSASIKGVSPYLEVWTRYQAAEREMLEDQAIRLEPLEYDERHLKHRRHQFRLKQPPPDAWLGEDRLPSLLINSNPRSINVGQATLRQREGRWWIETDNTNARPPQTGTLQVDTFGDEQRLKRREEALALLKARSTKLPDLAEILDGAGRTRAPTRRLKWGSPRVKKQLRGRALTEAQRRAVEVALNTPDIALIQGPPGTGKTTVIRAITNRLHDEGRHPVLLTSYQHEAVLRAVEGLVVGGIPAVRLGKRHSEDAAMSLRPLKDWLGGVRHQTTSALASTQAKPMVAMMAQARRRLAHFAQSPGDLELAAALVASLRRDLLEVSDPGVHAALEAAERTIDAGRRPPSPARAIDEPLIRQRLKAQALLPEHFADGGWLRARSLRLAITGLELEGSTLTALDAACAPGIEPPEGFEAALEAIQHALEHPPAPLDHDALTRGALRALDDSLRALQERLPMTVPDVLAQFLDQLDAQAVDLPHLISRYAPAVGATLQQAVGRQVSDWHEEFDTVIVDEAARANPLDILIPLVKGRRIILVGDQKQLPHMLEPRLERAIEAGAGGEAGRVLKESFFGRMWALYDASPPGGIPRCVRLDRQFRMHPVIGRFISDYFYGGGLENGVTEADRPAIPGLYGGRPIAWFNVPRGKEQGRYHRPEEVDVVTDLVRQALQAEAGLHIGVISFYKQQVQRLQRRARAEGWPREQVEVGTVDSFQGKEFDVVFLSTVRRGPKVGFLRMPNRLNVAMSRAMRALVVVADGKTVRQIPALKGFELCCREEGIYVDR